jgi:hypothetical protein
LGSNEKRTHQDFDKTLGPGFQASTIIGVVRERRHVLVYTFYQALDGHSTGIRHDDGSEKQKMVI